MNAGGIGSGGMLDIPIASKLVNKDIMAFIDLSASPSGNLRFRRMMSYRLKKDLDDVKEEKTRIFGGDNALNLTDINDRLFDSSEEDNEDALVHRIVKKFSDKYQEDVADDMTIDNILGLIESICKDAIMAQIGAVWGDDDGNMSSTMRSSVEDQVNTYVETLDESIPYYSTSENGRIEFVRDMDTHMNRAFVTLNRIVIPQNKAEFFPRVIRDLVFHLLEPWLAFKFLASFVPGEWNNISADLSDATSVSASFYDRRYAEFALFRVLIDISRECQLAISRIDIDNSSEIEGVLSQVTNDVLLKIKDKFLEKETKKLPQWYKSVSEASQRTKDDSDVLRQSDNQLTVRRQNLAAMLENKTRAERLTKRARTQFWVVTIIFIIVCIALSLLLFTQNFFAVYLLSTAVIVLAALLYGLAVLERWRKKKQKVNN